MCLFNVPEGQNYFNAIATAANFAWCHRKVITYEVRRTWQVVFGQQGALVSFKDIDLVVETVQEASIARKVARLRP